MGFIFLNMIYPGLGFCLVLSWVGLVCRFVCVYILQGRRHIRCSMVIVVLTFNRSC